MKKIILAATLLALAGTQVPTAKAHGFPIGAAIVGGAIVGTAVAEAVTAPPVYYAPAPVVYQRAPVYYAPAPVVYTQPGYAYAPVVTYGFGFGRPIYGYRYGYFDRGYYGHFHR